MKTLKATFVNTDTSRTHSQLVVEDDKGVLYTHRDSYLSIAGVIGRPLACMQGDVFEIDSVEPLIPSLKLI